MGRLQDEPLWLLLPPVKYDQDLFQGGELQRLVAAAVVSESFRARLLTNPKEALDTGYGGYPFRLLDEERERIISIQANSLAEFVTQLIQNTGDSLE